MPDPADIPTPGNPEPSVPQVHLDELVAFTARLGPMLQREFGLPSGEPQLIEGAWFMVYGTTKVGLDTFIAEPVVEPDHGADDFVYVVPADVHPDALDLAQSFHEAYEFLAPQHGYQTRASSAVPWVDVPARNKALMVATIDSLLKVGLLVRGNTTQPPVPPSGERFAQIQFTPTPEDQVLIESLRQVTGIPTTEGILAAALAHWSDHRGSAGAPVPTGPTPPVTPPISAPPLT